MFNSLNLKEITAIELKYLGNTNVQIAEKIDIPARTVEGWFISGGKLEVEYHDYSKRLNKLRFENVSEQIALNDQEVLITTTNVVRHFARRLQPREVTLVREDGNAILDENGKVKTVLVESDARFTMNDFKTAWQIQRIMQGKPIDYVKQEIETTSFEHDVVMKELGLTTEDFSDERIDETTKLITDYLLNRK